MSVTTNQNTGRRGDFLGSGTLATGVHLYQETLAFWNASGYLVGTTGSGLFKFAGQVEAERDNSGGNNGDLAVDLYQNTVRELVGSGFSLATVGKPIYATDNFTITDDPNAANAVFIGICMGYTSATKIWVHLIVAQPLQMLAVNVPIMPHASITTRNIYTAPEPMQVLALSAAPDLVQGGALTGTLSKATGTAAPAAATTPLHTGTIDFNAAANTVQPLTLTATGADLLLAAGDRIGLITSAALSTGVANVSILLRRLKR